jgi:hypothetical protein
MAVAWAGEGHILAMVLPNDWGRAIYGTLLADKSKLLSGLGMILYDLKCHSGHVFEAWFRDSAAYDAQRKSRKVQCPVCGTGRVDKAPMAPRLAKGAADAPVSQDHASTQAMEFLGQVRDHIEKNCDYVGPEFAEEARKIHYGETDKRNIYGEASDDEAKSLKEEGVEFGQIPWVSRRNS